MACVLSDTNVRGYNMCGRLWKDVPWKSQKVESIGPFSVVRDWKRQEKMLTKTYRDWRFSSKTWNGNQQVKLARVIHLRFLQ